MLNYTCAILHIILLREKDKPRQINTRDKLQLNVIRYLVMLCFAYPALEHPSPEHLTYLLCRGLTCHVHIHLNPTAYLEGHFRSSRNTKAFHSWPLWRDRP